MQDLKPRNIPVSIGPRLYLASTWSYDKITWINTLLSSSQFLALLGVNRLVLLPPPLHVAPGESGRFEIDYTGLLESNHLSARL